MGGRGGQQRDVQYDPIQLVRVIVYSEGQAINGISFTYLDKHGQHHEEGPWGGADEDETPHRVRMLCTSFVLAPNVN
jgi:hypothetical protein